MAQTRAKAGRPTKLNEKTVRLLESNLQFGLSITEACYEAKISRESFHKWYREDQVFADRMDMAKRQMGSLAKRNIHQALLKGDLKTSMWFIEKYYPDGLTTPLSEEMPELETSDDLTHDFKDMKKILLFNLEQEFMARKWGRDPNEKPSGDVQFNVRQVGNPDQRKDHDVFSLMKDNLT